MNKFTKVMLALLLVSIGLLTYTLKLQATVITAYDELSFADRKNIAFIKRLQEMNQKLAESNNEKLDQIASLEATLEFYKSLKREEFPDKEIPDIQFQIKPVTPKVN